MGQLEVEACAQFKQAVTRAGMARFLLEPAWGDGDSNRARYTLEAVVTWGCSYSFVACTGPRGAMPVQVDGRQAAAAPPRGGGAP